MQLYPVFTWELANSSESIREFSSSHQWYLMHLDFGDLVVSGFPTSCCLSGCCACWTSIRLSGLDRTVHLDHS